MYQVVLVLLAAVSGGLSQFVINGSCPIRSGSTASNNYVNITGTWYQIARIPNSEESGDCSTTFFGGIVASTISNREVINRKAVYNNGTIVLRPLEPHRFTVTFSNSRLPKDYYLVGTNFVSYALIARCDETSLTNNVTQTSVFAWKLSRTTALTSADNTTINQLLNGIPALSTVSWRTTSHTTTACQVTNGVGAVASSLVLIVTTLLFAAKENY